MSAAPVNCPRCGTALPPNAPEGLCPRCLGSLNFATETVVVGEEQLVPKPPLLTPGQLAVHFPQLEIIECLGRGGMGVVYQARQKSLNRLVALKLLAPERVLDARFAERFTHEAQALAKLSHPNIVTIHDFGEAGGFYFLLMEFVDGVNLRQLLRSRKLTPEEALAIVPPLCDALQYAHERGIVHRDIKPENLLLDKDGRVKVADFGIAKMLGTDGARLWSETQSQQATNAAAAGTAHTAALQGMTTAGTPGYMAPEQSSAPQKVDARADIYSLGVVFYEMLTGELPGAKLQPPSKKVQIDVRLDEIVLRALEQTPELRYQTAAELRTQVETVVSSPPQLPDAASGRNADSTPRLLKSARTYVSTPEHLASLWGKISIYTGKGRLTLDARHLTFVEDHLNTVIPLAAIHDLRVDQYSRVTKPTGLNFISVAFEEAGRMRRLCFTPNEGAFHSTWDTNLIVAEWFTAIQEAIIISTGRVPGTSSAEGRDRSAPSHRRRAIYPVAIALVLGLLAVGIVGIIQDQRVQQPPEPAKAAPREAAIANGAAVLPNRVRIVAGAPWVAQLPDGGSFELLAVRMHPSTNQPWWQPDGSPSSYDSSIEAEAKEQVRHGVMALARIHYPTNHESWPRPAGKKYPASMRLGNGPRFAVQNGRRLPMTTDASPRTTFGVVSFDQVLSIGNETTLLVNVATADWITMTTQRPGLKAALFADAARKEWKFSETPGGNLKVTLSHLMERPDMEYRLVAVDVDGMEYCPTGTQRTKRAGEGFATFEASFDPLPGGIKPWSLPLRRIREVRWEARPYERVEFRNVSLQPGHTTLVTVKDFGGEDQKVARPAATPARSELAMLSPIVGEGIDTNVFRSVTTLMQPRHVGVWALEIKTDEGWSQMPELDFWAVAFEDPAPFSVLAQWNADARTNGWQGFALTVEWKGQQFTSRAGRMDWLNDYSWWTTPQDQSHWVGPGEWNLNEPNPITIFEGVKRDDPNARATIRLNFSLFALPEDFVSAQRGNYIYFGQNWRSRLGLPPDFLNTPVAVSSPQVTRSQANAIGAPIFSILLVLVVLAILGGGVVLLIVLLRKRGSTAVKVLAVLCGVAFLLFLLVVGLVFVWFKASRAEASRAVAVEQAAVAEKQELQRQAEVRANGIASPQASIPMQIDFKVLRVENPPGTRNILLHFERDTNYGLSIEVSQNVMPSPDGKVPAAGHRDWQQKTWIGLHAGQVLRWTLPAEFSEADVRAAARDMQNKWRSVRLLPDGAVPEFANVKHRDGWTYILMARVLREPGAPRPRPPGNAVLLGESVGTVPAGAVVKVEWQRSVKDVSLSSIGVPLTFKVAEGQPGKLRFRWYTYGSKNPMMAGRWFLDIHDEYTGQIFHRVEDDFGRPVNFVSPIFKPEKVQTFTLGPQAAAFSLHKIIHAEPITPPGQPITDWWDVIMTVIPDPLGKHQPVPAFQLPSSPR